MTQEESNRYRFYLALTVGLMAFVYALTVRDPLAMVVIVITTIVLYRFLDWFIDSQVNTGGERGDIEND